MTGTTDTSAGPVVTGADALVDPFVFSAGPGPALVRALTGQTLTGAGGVVVALLVLTPGVVVDLVTDATFGLPSTIGFLLAATAAALVVRTSGLVTAAMLPPVLFAGAVSALAWFSGHNEGARELVLDVGTTLALSAPVLFAGSAACLAVVLGRLLWQAMRR